MAPTVVERGPLVTLANGVLYRRRRALHLTQHQLADLLGIPLDDLVDPSGDCGEGDE